jgi:drug/metabolite transporter (DMT)-like permease
MLYLVLSILCSVCLGFIFKLFPRYGVDTFQAIVFNYCTCVLCGWLYLGTWPVGPAAGTTAGWLPYSLGLGIFFITGFTAAARTVREFGVTISQIMQKMTIILVVPFAILWLGEASNWVKWLGTLFAIGAIVLVNLPAPSGESESTQTTSKSFKINQLWLPVLTWVLACVIDLTFTWVQHKRLIEAGDVRFITTTFGTAGVLGGVAMVAGWFTGRLRFDVRNILAGVVLGIPNFGSLSFLLLALGSGLGASQVFPMVNVGIILVTTFGAILLFRERLTVQNWVGVALALTAILMLR